MAERSGSRGPDDVAALVDNMFADVMTPEERAGLLEWIQAWEDANPGASSHVRVTAWIDVAYAYSTRQTGESAASAARVHPMVSGVPKHA